MWFVRFRNPRALPPRCSSLPLTASAGAVRRAGPVVEREDVRGALREGPAELADLGQRGRDAAGDGVDHGRIAGQAHDVERVHHRDRVGQFLAGGGLETGEPRCRHAYRVD
jgi:hypothetical protein